MTAIHAARVAKKLRQLLRIEPQMVHGRYGEFKVLVAGDTIVDSGALAALGVLPSPDKIAEAVANRLMVKP